MASIFSSLNHRYLFLVFIVVSLIASHILRSLFLFCLTSSLLICFCGSEFWFPRTSILILDLTATYFVSGEVDTAATFARTLHFPVNALTGEAARVSVVAALRDLHIVDEADTARLWRGILRYFNDLGIHFSTSSGIYEFKGAMHYNFYYLDELPPVTEFYVGASPPEIAFTGDDDDSDSGTDTDADDDGIILFRVSEESMERLEKEKTEKAVICGVCLIEAPIGSELTKLPCSHRYHEECIVSWLERSKFCPYCRFELP